MTRRPWGDGLFRFWVVATMLMTGSEQAGVTFPSGQFWALMVTLFVLGLLMVVVPPLGDLIRTRREQDE